MDSAASQSLAGRTSETVDLTREERGILRIFTALLIILIVFQKFGVPTAVTPIPLIVPAMWISVLYLLSKKQVRIDPVRCALYMGFAGFAIFGNLMLSSGFKVSSLMIVLSIYGLYIFRMDVSEQLYRAAYNNFVNIMICTLPLIMFQWAMQVAVHPGLWGDFEPLVPSQILIQGYNYNHTLKWGSAWILPNAMLFLEVSILAQFLSFALLIEFSLFQRTSRFILLGLALAATLAASGPFMLGLCAPFILWKFPRRLIVPASLGIAALLVVVKFTNVFSTLLSRTSETNDPSSSGYLRLILPTRVLLDYLSSGGNFFGGLGAGSGEELNAGLPLAKATLEYGIPCTIFLMALLIYTTCTSGKPAVFVWAIFVFYNLMGGGFAVPIYGVTCTLLCGFMVWHAPSRRELDYEPPPAPVVANRRRRMSTDQGLAG